MRFPFSLLLLACLLSSSLFGESLVGNGDFRGGLSGWGGEGEVCGAGGDDALRMSSELLWKVCYSDSFAVAPGQAYEVRGRMRLENAKQSHCKINWQGKNGRVISSSFLMSGQDGTCDWKEWSGVFQAPAGVVSANVEILAGGERGREGVTWFDDLTVVPQDPAAHAKGLLPDFAAVRNAALGSNAMKPVGESREIAFAGRAIVVPASLAIQDPYAARLLSRLLESAFGCPFPVVTEGDFAGGPFLSVGDTLLARQAGVRGCPEEQGYRIAVDDAGNLFFQGGANGALYGVLAFLQEDLGCRFFDPDEPIQTPALSPEATLPVVPREYAPCFEMREPYNGEFFGRQDYNAFNRIQAASYFKVIPREKGDCGIANVDYFIHTYAPLVPAEQYFQSHPEFFPLRKGGRYASTPTTGQLCYTAPGLAEVLCEKLLAHQKIHPTQKVYSVSHNDNNYMECLCDSCQKLIREEGISACTLLVANRAAEILSRTNPEARVTTLAYVETQPLPATLRPHPNTVPFYAPIRQRNAALSQLPWRDIPKVRKEIADWTAASKRVYVWDYVINKALEPHLDMLDVNVHDWRDWGVKGVFLEDLEFGLNSLEGLKTWVMGQKLWNPDWDLDALIDDYMEGFYGDAADFMKRYFAIQRKAWRDWYADPDRLPSAVMRFTPEQWRGMEELLEQAYEVAPGRKVAREIVALDHFLLKNCTREQVQVFEARLNRALELIQEHDISLWESSRELHDGILQSWKNTLQDALRGYDFPLESPESIILKEKYARLPGCEEDAALQGAYAPPAMKQSPGTDWGVQWPFDKLLDNATNQAVYVAKLRIRPHFTKAHDPAQKAFALKLYRAGFDLQGVGVQGRDVAFGELENDQWQEIYLYQVYLYSPSVDGCFFQETSNLAPGEAIYTDILEFIPLEHVQNARQIQDLPSITL